MRTDAPTCRLGDRLLDVRPRVLEGGWDMCLVQDENGVVLGRVGRAALRADDDVSAEQAMTPGPGTVRPSTRLVDVVERMRRRDLMSLPVTTLDGLLVGVLRREDAERAAKAWIRRAET